MLSKLRGFWPARRAATFAEGIVKGVWDTFLRDNKVIPPVLAVLALFVFAWILAGSFIGGPDDEPVSNRGDIAQSQGGQAPAPEIENPNADSYAAYQSKDPFRQLFETTEAAEADGDQTGGNEDGSDTDDSTGDPTDDSGTFDDGGSGGSIDDGTSDPDGSTSEGNPGAGDDQYDNGAQPPRQDPTDADDDQYQAPPAQTDDDGLLDSGGDLSDPYERGGDIR